MSNQKVSLPKLEFTEEDLSAQIRNAQYHNGNLASELSCRERQLLAALERIAELEMEVKARDDARTDGKIEMLDSIRETLKNRALGVNTGGDTEIMKSVDKIVKSALAAEKAIGDKDA
jgi:hypothetical protein